MSISKAVQAGIVGCGSPFANVVNDTHGNASAVSVGLLGSPINFTSGVNHINNNNKGFHPDPTPGQTPGPGMEIS